MALMKMCRIHTDYLRDSVLRLLCKNVDQVSDIYGYDSPLVL